MSPAKKPTAKSSASKTKSGAAKSKPSASRKSSASKTKSSAAKKKPKEPAKAKSSSKKTAAQSKASKPKSKAASTKASTSRGSKSDKSSGTGSKKTPASSSRNKTSARAATKAPGRTGSGRTTPSSGRSTRARPVKFDAKALAAIRERLTKEREDLKQQIVEIDEESFEGTQSDLTGEAAIDEDFADAGTATFDRERALSLQNNSRDLIGQIDRALERIDDGTYGSCDRCGKPIDAARIKALPHASLCMDCKRREERAR